MKKLVLAVMCLVLVGLIFTSCNTETVDVEKITKEAEENGYEVITSRAIVSDSGEIFFYNEKSLTAIPSYYDKHYLTENINSGDLVIFTGLLKIQSYSANYLELKNCAVLEKGSVNDITDEMLEPLVEYGFVDDILREKRGETLDTSSWQDVYYELGDQSIRLKLPEDWEYVARQGTEDVYEGVFEIKFWPKGEEGYIGVAYCKSYGICGTGLTTIPYSAGSYSISASTYGAIGNWDMINISMVPGNYDIFCRNTSSWYEEYKDEVENIFTTLVVAENIIDRDTAFSKAYELYSKDYGKEYESASSSYRDHMGCWYFSFSYYPENSTKREYVKINVYSEDRVEIELEN